MTDGRELLAQASRRPRQLLPGRADLRSMRRDPLRDLLAGLTVATVALPLALAFGITSGLGPRAGLVTAVVAGFVAALFGGSNLQVSGPTGAMTVVLLPIVARQGPNGVLLVGLLAGLVLIGLALTGVGRYMQYVPLPVVEGFTLGIAVIIGLQQLPAALGVHARGTKVVAVAFHAMVDASRSLHWAPLVIAVSVVGTMMLAARFRPGLPVSLALLLVATGVVAATGLDTPVIGTIPTGLPTPHLPALSGLSTQLLGPAVAVAALAALESLLSASVADAMSVGERHDPHRELFGQGLANLASPLFGGIPATAAIARTAVNVRSGARSRLASMVHAVTIGLVLLLGTGAVARVPLAALAGILLATALQMVEASSLRALLRATRSDATVLVTTAAATLLLDLVTAVLAGLVLAGALSLRELARAARVEETPLDHADHSEEERALLKQHIVAYRLDGPLFFGAAHSAVLELSAVQDVRVVILRMSRVATLDATGASVLADAVKRLEGRGITVLLSGVREQHVRVLQHLGVYDELAHERHVFATTPEAIAHATAHAAR